MGYRPAYYLDAMISQPASVRFANGNLQIPGPVGSPVVLPGRMVLIYKKLCPC